MEKPVINMDFSFPTKYTRYDLMGMGYHCRDQKVQSWEISLVDRDPGAVMVKMDRKDRRDIQV